jgi:hypothetical protein
LQGIRRRLLKLRLPRRMRRPLNAG